MKSTQYTEKTLEHFRDPRNVGTLEGPNVAVGRVGNPVCGDLMDIYIRVDATTASKTSSSRRSAAAPPSPRRA